MSLLKWLLGGRRYGGFTSFGKILFSDDDAQIVAPNELNITSPGGFKVNGKEVTSGAGELPIPKEPGQVPVSNEQGGYDAGNLTVDNIEYAMKTIAEPTEGNLLAAAVDGQASQTTVKVADVEIVVGGGETTNTVLTTLIDGEGNVTLAWLPASGGGMQLVSNPTAGHLLTTDADGQAQDSGSLLSGFAVTNADNNFSAAQTIKITSDGPVTMLDLFHPTSSYWSPSNQAIDIDFQLGYGEYSSAPTRVGRIRVGSATSTADNGYMEFQVGGKAPGDEQTWTILKMQTGYYCDTHAELVGYSDGFGNHKVTLSAVSASTDADLCLAGQNGGVVRIAGQNAVAPLTGGNLGQVWTAAGSGSAAGWQDNPGGGVNNPARQIAVWTVAREAIDNANVPGTINGYAISDGQTFLETLQADPKDNGVYVFHAGSPNTATRVATFDAGMHIAGTIFPVLGGSEVSTYFYCSNDPAGDTIGANNIYIDPFRGAGDIHKMSAVTTGNFTTANSGYGVDCSVYNAASFDPAGAADDAIAFSRIGAVVGAKKFQTSTIGEPAHAWTWTELINSKVILRNLADQGAQADSLPDGLDIISEFPDLKTGDTVYISALNITEAGSLWTLTPGSGGTVLNSNTDPSGNFQVQAGEDWRITINFTDITKGETPSVTYDVFVEQFASKNSPPPTYSAPLFERFADVMGSKNDDSITVDLDAPPTNALVVDAGEVVASGSWTHGTLNNPDVARNLVVVYYNSTNAPLDMYEGKAFVHIKSSFRGQLQEEDIPVECTSGNKTIAAGKYRVAYGTLPHELFGEGSDITVDHAPADGITMGVGIGSRIAPMNAGLTGTSGEVMRTVQNGTKVSVDSTYDGSTINWDEIADGDDIEYWIKAKISSQGGGGGEG